MRKASGAASFLSYTSSGVGKYCECSTNFEGKQRKSARMGRIDQEDAGETTSHLISFSNPLPIGMGWRRAKTRCSARAWAPLLSPAHKTTLQTMTFVSWRDSQNAAILAVDRAGGTDGDDRPQEGEGSTKGLS